jgi:hypothetical protein
MSTLLIEEEESATANSSRELLLIWQNPSSRKFSRAGHLSIMDSSFEFHYSTEVADDPDFFPLDEFPDLSGSYTSARLPAFFANRVMSQERDNFAAYLDLLGLASDAKALPVEILVRTGGSRATDTFHIVERPRRDAKSFVSRFFVSGIGHQPFAEDHVRILSDGDQLLISAEPDNPMNTDAHLILKSEGSPIGWVPDWLCGEVAALSKSGWSHSVVAEKVNRDAPVHVRVLCRLEAQREQ